MNGNGEEDLLSYAEYIVGPSFKSFTATSHRSLWGLVEQKVTLNLLYCLPHRRHKKTVDNVQSCHLSSEFL